MVKDINIICIRKKFITHSEFDFKNIFKLQSYIYSYVNFMHLFSDTYFYLENQAQCLLLSCVSTSNEYFSTSLNYQSKIDFYLFGSKCPGAKGKIILSCFSQLNIPAFWGSPSVLEGLPRPVVCTLSFNDECSSSSSCKDHCNII